MVRDAFFLLRDQIYDFYCVISRWRSHYFVICRGWIVVLDILILRLTLKRDKD